MIITGISRGGTSLLLSLLYATVDRNKTEVLMRETSDGWANDRVISKNPSAVVEIPNIYRPVILIRDPRAVITSQLGPYNYFVSADFCYNRRDPGVLPTADAIKKQLNSSLILRYEHLVQRPDQAQAMIAQHWAGVSFLREFSDYPHAIPQDLLAEINACWGEKLGSVRAFDSGHDWRLHMQRIREQFDAFPQLFDVMRAWAYEHDDNWYEEVLANTHEQPYKHVVKRHVAQPKGLTIGFTKK